MAASIKIDSNITGLRYAEEVSLGTLDPVPANQTWYELEPNSYPDFGGETETVARNPINPGRQRKKGVTTNVTATAGFNTDLTQQNLQDILQGFLFADMRRKQEFTGSITVDGTTDEAFDATGIDTGFFVGDLIFTGGFANAVNNGLHFVDAVAAGTLEVTSDLVQEGPVVGATVVAVGFQFGSGDAQISAPGGGVLPPLTTTTKDLTQLGLSPGEWVFIGGDATATQFATGANNGFARVRSVATNAIFFDKTSAVMVTDNGSGKTIRLFKGRVLKNEIGTDIVRRTYTLERTLGFSDDLTPTQEQAEYVAGAVPGEFTMNVSSASKLECDLSFSGTDFFTIDEAVAGDLLSKVSGVVRVPVEEASAFNTSSDVSRVRLSRVVDGEAFSTPLFTYSEEITLNINNNLTLENAIGVTGAFEVSAGTFEVGGDITAYFGNVAATQAVRDNVDITLDIIFAKENAGIAIDLPLITLGDGRPNVEQDAAIRLPLSNQAATGAKIHPTLNHTLLMVFFDFLPTLAE